jgi:hypothetical protein
MRELKKIFLTGVLLGVLIIFSINIVNAICCEQTTDSGICLNVGDEQYCNDEFRIADTACESTQYCSTGTCVNNAEGTCMVSSSATCDPNLGGYWYDDFPQDLSECKFGCCLIGEGAAFVPQITCYKMAADIEVQPDFRATITTQEKCLQMGGPTNKGACVFQTEIGRECTIETRENCNEEAGQEFSVGLLCSAPKLGTICKMTQRTTCVEGRHEVFFVDSCENPANVYDASQVDIIDYWTYMKDPASPGTCYYGDANTKSPTCGNCNYIGGSTCAEKKIGQNVRYGNYICKDLSCDDYDGDGYREAHGSAWCFEPLEDFETAKPGDSSYRLYCYNGEIQWESCGNLREKLCKQDGTEANCLMNRWQYCMLQDNKKDCLNTEKRDCKIVKGISKKNEDGKDILFDNSDGLSDPIKAICVAKYPPGFNFWASDIKILGISPKISPTEVCGSANAYSIGGYFKRILTEWEAIKGECFGECIEECEEKTLVKLCQKGCFKDCDSSESFEDQADGKSLGDVDLVKNWAKNQEDLCMALGDCGVKANYIEQDGYYSWKQLFIGDDISTSNIPGANSNK